MPNQYIEKFSQYFIDRYNISDLASLCHKIECVEKDSKSINFLLHITEDKKPAFSDIIKKISEVEDGISNLLAKKVRIIFTQHNALKAKAKSSEQTKIKHKLAKVQKVILVASGKGGVGKSTVSCLLAFALAKKGLRVGVLDADIYGPSIPQLIGISEQPQTSDNKLNPLKKYDIEFMSIGFLVDQTKAAAWRGPMATKALHQMLLQTNWGTEGELEYLIIDTPPGTGDIHLSLIENYHIDGAVIVSTPHSLAIQDTKKGIDLFHTTNIPIQGLVINMGYYQIGSNIVHPFGKIALDKFKGINKVIELPLYENVAQASNISQLIKLARDENFDIDQLVSLVAGE